MWPARWITAGFVSWLLVDTFCSLFFCFFALHPFCAENKHINSQLSSKEYVSSSYDTFSLIDYRLASALKGVLKQGSRFRRGICCSNPQLLPCRKEGIFPFLPNSLKRPNLFSFKPEEKCKQNKKKILAGFSMNFTPPVVIFKSQWTKPAVVKVEDTEVRGSAARVVSPLGQESSRL